MSNIHARFLPLYQSLNAISSLSNEDWSHFEEYLSEVVLNRGELFLSAGDEVIKVALVLEGQLRTYYLDEKGEEFVKNFSKPMELISDYSAAIRKVPSELFLDALEDTRMIAFDYRHLENLYDRFPAWQRLGRKIAERYYLVRERHARDLLLHDATVRYQLFYTQFPHLVGKVSQKYIAQYLGISEVSL
ncbi:MAG: Crp/Fnr family transcriptional regulator, partial [Proteobacteria bacterium]|nr:Crp/Fnr family transcriptional regulator [Pseudomonadota bacterium]